MPFIAYITIPCVISLIMPIAIAVMHKKARENERQLNKSDFTMRASRVFSACMMIFTIVWVGLIILLNFIDNVKIWVNLILWICECFLILCFIQSVRQKIIVNLKKITYTPILGITKTIEIKEIDKVAKCFYSRGLMKYKIYVKSKLFCTFAETATGSMILIDILKKSDIPFVDG